MFLLCSGIAAPEEQLIQGWKQWIGGIMGQEWFLERGEAAMARHLAAAPEEILEYDE